MRGSREVWAALALLAWAAAPARCGDFAGLQGFARAGKVDGQVRLMYMHRYYSTPRTQESMAGGGWLRYETPQLKGLSAGGVGYLSQRLGVVPGDRDGASLLGPGQTSYAVLGQAYLMGRLGRTSLTLYRQALETPFINGWDVKMTRVTHEAYTLVSSAAANLELTASVVTRIKPWSSSRFLTMSAAAGFPGTDYPVTLAGASYRPIPEVTVQAWEYYCQNYMNVNYFQADTRWPVWRAAGLDLGLSAQGFIQKDVGRAVGGPIRTGSFGGRSQAFWKGLTATAGFSATNKGHDFVNPWGGYPGYTSIMEEDNDLAGDRSILLGLAYGFKGGPLDGLSAFMDHTQADLPGRGWAPYQKETNLTADYRFHGWARGLWLRLRGAWVSNSDTNAGVRYSDYRAILNFDF